MPFIYQADLWCDSCGRDMCQRLTRQGNAPSNPDDECSFDSDDYPKFVSDPGEADCPQHCGADDDCLEAVVLSSGRKIGALLSDSLTDEGVRYVQESVQEGGEVAEFWAGAFAACL